MEMGNQAMDDTKIIDVDVHNEQDDRALLPYLQEPWRSR